MSKLYIITVATDPVCYFPYLKESIKRNGGELIVLGFGEKWKGFTWRYSLVLDKLKELNDYDIVCYIDGYDIICTKNLETLKNDFIRIKERENCKMIAGHDKIIEDTVIQKFKKNFAKIYYGRCNNVQLNAGTCIGYAKDIKYIFKNIYELKNSNIEDDQLLLTDYCHKNKNDIYIDTQNELFLTISKSYDELDKYIKFSDNKITYQNDNHPYFIHACSEGYLDNIIILLGYNMNSKVKDEIKKKMYKKIFKEIENFFKRNSVVIILFVFIVIFFYLIYKINK